MTRLLRPPVVALAVALLLAAAPRVRAQGELSGSTEELEAFEAVRGERWVRARELAERLVRRHPDSFIGHHVLAVAQHEGEANFPVALRHEQKALELFAARYGDPPTAGAPWRWHAMMLGELAGIYGDLERHQDRLDTIDRSNAIYSPRMMAERAWSLMKLRRFEEARLAAREGIATRLPWQVEMGLNALCAIEFEAGEYGRSYVACRDALEFGRQSSGGAAVVDLTNFAEAARTELRLTEAEETLREATGLLDGGYGNPWLELGELTLREGRFADSLEALRHVPEVRAMRVPSMRDSDRNESMRALASFYLVNGRSEDALRVTTRAIVQPDRRGHNSRDPAQDRAIVALLDRAARSLRAGALLEEHRGGPLGASLGASFQSLGLRFTAWQSGREAVEWLDDREHLVGILRIGLSTGGITPPWLVSDLTSVLGPSVMRSAVREARRGDRRPLARGYYDAMEAETWLATGDESEAATLARRAIRTLPAEEGLLRARAFAVLGQAQLAAGSARQAGRSFESALALDPSVLRRLDVALPARVRASGGGLASALRDRLEASGRFDDSDATFTVDVRASGGRSRICLRGPTRAFACGEATRKARESDDAFQRRALRAFYDGALAPGLGLSERDVNELEGPTRTQRTPLDTILGRQELETPVQ